MVVARCTSVVRTKRFNVNKRFKEVYGTKYINFLPTFKQFYKFLYYENMHFKFENVGIQMNSKYDIKCNAYF